MYLPSLADDMTGNAVARVFELGRMFLQGVLCPVSLQHLDCNLDVVQPHDGYPRGQFCVSAGGKYCCGLPSFKTSSRMPRSSCDVGVMVHVVASLWGPEEGATHAVSLALSQ